jgi:AraC-like DNA-binding protein
MHNHKNPHKKLLGGTVGGQFGGTETWRQRVGGFVEIPGLLRELGTDPAQVLIEVGLEPDALACVDSSIPYIAAAQLLHHCAQKTGCAHFGLLIGQRWSLSHFGAIGQLMKNSCTVGEALRTLAVYQRLNSDAGAAFVLEHGTSMCLGYTIYRAEVPHHDHIYDLTVAFICNILRELCGSRWAASEVVFSRAEPAEKETYRQHFRAPIRFDHTYSAVRFDTHWKERVVPGASSQQRAALTEAIEADSSEFVSQLHRSLRLLLLTGKHSGGDLAQTLSMHRRTLNRRLKAQGTTFQRVLDEVRFEVARALLEDTRAPISDVATALCYSEVSAFMHAFRRWTGTTPAQWRKGEGKYSEPSAEHAH